MGNMPDQDFSHLLVDRSTPIWRVTLNRPAVKNAHDTQTFREIVAAFDEAEADEACRCVVLSGAGDIFSAGQDLAFTRAADTRAADEYGRWNVAARQRIQRNHKPVVAAVNGPAIGGGVYLATACDIIVAVDTAWFQMREIQAGNHAGGFGLFTIGRARSLEMTLLGKRVSAATALDWGLINQVVPAEEFPAAVAAMAAELAALPPLAVRYTKASTNILLDAAGFSAHLDASAPMQRYLSLSPDGREAKRAFAEKRKPAFTGRYPEPQP
jgi:enoyl-CoA hydratase/carnithine racemase